jgi:DNA-binding transcriptional regulator/RsmH inhibitor MraZ
MSHIVSLDEKGRIKIPADMRGAVEKLKDTEGKILLMIQLIRIAIAYTVPEPVLQKLSKDEKKIYRVLMQEKVGKGTLIPIQDRLRLQKMIDGQNEPILDSLLAILHFQAWIVSVDAQNRILLPKDVRAQLLGGQTLESQFVIADDPVTPALQLLNRQVWDCIEKLTLNGVPVMMNTPLDKVYRNIYNNREQAKEKNHEPEKTQSSSETAGC